MPKFTVAIVGAGLSGLAFAIALQKYAPDVDFEIYEGASQLAEVGAGVGMQRRTWTIMQALGVDESLLKIAGNGERPTVTVMFRKSDQAEGVPFHSLTSNEKSYTFHRAELHKVFQDHIQPSHTIHLSKRLTSYTQPADGTGKIELHFQDGTTATCDILVGCDGVRSGTRAAMFSQMAEAAQTAGKEEEANKLRSHIPAIFSGGLVYRGLVRKDALPEEIASLPALNNPNMVLYCGKNRHVIGYPISQGRVLNVAALVFLPEQVGTIYQGPWSSSVGRDEFVSRFAGWEPEVEEILKHVDGVLKWAINVVEELPTYVRGRVALLGDAAHAMTPHQGAGAGQCFDDAFTLAQFLGRADITIDTAPIALQVYDEIRRPYSQAVARLSLRSGQMHLLNAPEHAWLTEEQSATGEALTMEQLQKIGNEVERLRTDWLLVAPLEEGNDKSLRKLDEALSKI